MTSLTKIYKKSTTYQLNLQGIIPVTGYYQTTITGTHFISGEKVAAAATKITAPPVLKLAGTKSTPTKKAPVLTIVAPAVLATEQNSEPAESGSSDDGGESSEEPDHEAALARLISLLEYEVALSLEEELEEVEDEQEEQIDWTDDAEVGNTLIDTSNTLTRLEFLRNVLPPTGMYCVVAIQKGRVIQTFPESIEAVDAWAELQPALGNDAYFALATFDTERRLARCALEYKCVWVELDCGVGTAYATQDEGMVALKAFVDKVKLPKPTIVSSGSGAHVYFGFTEAVNYDTWHGVATALKARIIAENFQVNDAGLPTNSMRILRLPNTINFKNNIETEVKVLIAGTNATVEDYNRILNVGAEISPTVITPKKDFVPNATVAPVVKAPAKVEKVFVADAAKPEVKQLFDETPVVNKVNSLGDSLINYLPNVMAPTNFTTITLEEALTNIESGKFAELLAPVRAAYKESLVSGNKTEYTRVKTKLPSYAFNGTFTERVKNEHLLKSSNLFCGDVDGLGGEDEVAATISKLIQEVPSLVSVFRSPSNDGVKFILALPVGFVSNGIDFNNMFGAVEHYFKQRLDVAIDKACKDVRRVSFVSDDPDIYINYNAVPFLYVPVADEAKSKTEAFGETSTAVNTYLENLAIDVASGLLRKAKAGERHGARVKVGKLVGGYVAGGWAREDLLVAAVMFVSDEISDGSHTNDVEIKTIHDGIAYGKGSPITEEMFKKEQGINMELGFANGVPVEDTAPNDNKISFSTDKYGARLPSRNNLYKAFSNPSFCGVHIKYDEFKQEPKWRFEGGEVWRDMLNTSYTAMLVHLTANHKFKDAASAVGREVIDLVADENRFDSAIDWINSIHWDGKERVKDFHTAYVDISEEHTDDDDKETITDVAAYGRAVAEYMFTAMAGRVLVPDVKADMAPVYVSDEGFKKSSLVLALAPEPHMYVNISFANATVPDIVRNTRGKNVVELAELEGFNKKSGEEVKNFMTSTGDTFAEKYEKRATANPRRFIFIGTTNEKQFMVNSIGKRRWLPMMVKHINIEAIRNDIEQLWAEGAVLFKKNGVMYEAAEKLARFEHGKYTGDHCWAFPIFDYLIKCVKGDLPIYATAVLNGISISTEHFDQRKINEVTKVLTSLGCVQGIRKSINGVRVQTWVITPQLKKRIDDEIAKNQPQSKPLQNYGTVEDLLKDWEKD